MKNPWDGTPIHYTISIKDLPKAKAFRIHPQKDGQRYGHSVDIPCVECGAAHRPDLIVLDKERFCPFCVPRKNGHATCCTSVHPEPGSGAHS